MEGHIPKTIWAAQLDLMELLKIKRHRIERVVGLGTVREKGKIKTHCTKFSKN